jgi:hypothetical protein
MQIDSSIINVTNKIKDFFKRPKSNSICLIIKIMNYFLTKGIIPYNQASILTKIALYFSKDRKYVFSNLIFHSKPLRAKKYFSKINEVEIHSVIQHEAVSYYILAIKSFLYYLDFNLPVTLHDDGSLSDLDIKILKYHIPHINIIKYESAKKEILNKIKKYKYLYKNRNCDTNVYHLITTLDIPFFSKSKKIIYLDSDVLFYGKPQKIINWINDNGKSMCILFQRDYVDAHALTKKELMKYFELEYYPNFNMGILCYFKKSLDFESLNYYFKVLDKLNKIKVPVSDQTYWMIHALKFYDKRIQLNKNYIVSFASEVSHKTVCFHYTSEIRDNIYVEGIQVIFKINII